MESYKRLEDENDIRMSSAIMKSAFVTALVVFLTEALIATANYSADNLKISILEFCFRYLIFPSTINFGSWILVYRFCKNSSVSVKSKLKLQSLQMFLMAIVIEMVHHVFQMLMAAPIAAVFLSILAVEVSLFNLEFVLAVIAGSVAIWLEYQVGNMNLIRAVYNELVMLMLNSLLFVLMYKSAKRQQDQIKLLVAAGKRHEELISRLKIEPMTGLYNHKSFEESAEAKITNAMDRSFRGERVIPPIMAMLDIDHFKRINDTYGHQNGDEVIIFFAAAMASRVRGIASAFRYGGEEFVILFDKSSMEEAVAVVEDIRRDLSSHRFDFARGEHITASAGITELSPGMDSAHWINAVDNALYKAKKNGRNRIVMG